MLLQSDLSKYKKRFIELSFEVMDIEREPNADELKALRDYYDRNIGYENMEHHKGNKEVTFEHYIKHGINTNNAFWSKPHFATYKEVFAEKPLSEVRDRRDVCIIALCIIPIVAAVALVAIKKRRK